jgi:hypothetical protein
MRWRPRPPAGRSGPSPRGWGPASSTRGVGWMVDGAKAPIDASGLANDLLAYGGTTRNSRVCDPLDGNTCKESPQLSVPIQSEAELCLLSGVLQIGGTGLGSGSSHLSEALLGLRNVASLPDGAHVEGDRGLVPLTGGRRDSRGEGPFTRGPACWPSRCMAKKAPLLPPTMPTCRSAG